MKQLTKLFIFIFLFGFQNSFSNTIFDNNDKEIEQILTELRVEINTTTKHYRNLKQEIYTKLNQLNKNLVTETVLEIKFTHQKRPIKR